MFSGHRSFLHAFKTKLVEGETIGVNKKVIQERIKTQPFNRVVNNQILTAFARYRENAAKKQKAA